MRVQRGLRRLIAASAVLAGAAETASAQNTTYRWQTNSGNPWGNSGSWFPIAGSGTTFPNNATDTASFTATLSPGAVTVSLDASYTVGAMVFDFGSGGAPGGNATSWTITPTVATNTLTLGATSTPITVNSATPNPITVTIGAILAGTGVGINKAGSGGAASVLTLTANNTYTGATTVGTGELQIGGGGAAGSISASSGVAMTTGTTLTHNRTGADTIAGAITSGGAVTVNKQNTSTLILTGTNTYTGTTNVTGGTLQIGTGASSGAITNSAIALSAGTTLVHNRNGGDTTGGVISGAGAVTKVGSGTWGVNAANSYTGVTTISGGTLVATALADAGTNSSIGQGNAAATHLVFNGGILQYNAGTTSTNRAFTLTGAGTIDVTTLATNLTVGGAGTGAGAFTKAGAGTLTFTAAQGYTGGTSVTGGTLQIGTGGSLNGTGNVTLSSGTTLNHNRGGTDTINGNITPATSGGALTKDGGGTLILTGTNSYTGATTITGNSTLQLGNGASAGTLGNTNVSIGAGSTLAVSKVGSTDTISGQITGSGALTKTGSSTLTFTGNSGSYTGNTTLNASSGTVRVASGATLGSNGTQTVAVGASTTLGGEGTIGGVTTYSSTSTLDIGNGTAADIGTLTFSNTLNLNSGATAAFDFNNTLGSTAAGVGYDAVVVSGAANSITLGGAIQLTVNNTGGTSFVGVPLRIIDGTAGALTMGTEFSNYAQGAQVTELNGFGGVSQWFMNYDYANGDVRIVPIPEPGTVLGVAAAGLGLARWVRRRKAKAAGVVAAV